MEKLVSFSNQSCHNRTDQSHIRSALSFLRLGGSSLHPTPTASSSFFSIPYHQMEETLAWTHGGQARHWESNVFTFLLSNLPCAPSQTRGEEINRQALKQDAPLANSLATIQT
uniref:Uncharacterized protein n=1 Tax=Entomoneis paludosa TaxID=265537 RepID=A0A7S2YP04_9STRA